MSSPLMFSSFDGRDYIRVAHGDDAVMVMTYRAFMSSADTAVVLTAAEALRLADVLRQQATLAAEVGAVRVSGEEQQQ